MRGASVLNQGPPPANSGAFEAPPAPPGVPDPEAGSQTGAAARSGE